MSSCPDCGEPLVRTANGEVSFDCSGCGGRLRGLSPFERSLPEGRGARIWAASEEGAPGGACPLCGLPMRSPSADPEAPEGLLVCRLCSEVWVPPAAVQALTPPQPVTAPLPERCPGCGAPFEPDARGHCRYCRAQIAAPAPVVVQL